MIKQSSKPILPFILLSGILISACSGDKSTQEAPEDLGTPPSLNSAEGLRVVNLEAEQSEQLDIAHYSIEMKIIEVGVEAPGRVQASPEYYAMVSSPIAGIITALYAHEGEEVKRGQDLLEMESLDYANLVADFIETSAEYAYLSEQSERIKKLREENISSAQEYNRVMADYNRASARRLTLIARLKALGLTEARLSEWEENPESASARLRMTAPISGKINQHLIDIGEPVKAYAMMLDIINPEEVLVKGYFHPEDAELIEAGDSVFVLEKHLHSDQMHEMASGLVSTINPALDETNRSVIVNSFVKTQNGRPSAGEQVLVKVSGNSLRPLVEIPSTAIVYDGDEAGVFVRMSDLRYEFRPVDILRMYEGKAAITSGLQDGEEVAITQVFSLKALLRFEKFAE
jgi:cobalt-zinc-cadmium efflux system membrane fusion protein